MRDKQGRFQKGIHAHPETEFKKGSHWRPSKPHWNKAWLENEYLIKKLTVSEIAALENCTLQSILHWMDKFNIPRRTMSEHRKLRYWGLSGTDNPMFGKKGDRSPMWKGGLTPERQAFYSSPEWAKAVDIVWGRDKATCRLCNRKAKGRPFHIHHQVGFSIETLRMNLDNLILLCPKCHRFVHSKKNIKKILLDSFQETMRLKS